MLDLSSAVVALKDLLNHSVGSLTAAYDLVGPVLVVDLVVELMDPLNHSVDSLTAAYDLEGDHVA